MKVTIEVDLDSAECAGLMQYLREIGALEQDRLIVLSGAHPQNSVENIGETIVPVLKRADA